MRVSSPRERAFDLISGTKVRDIEVRKKLYEGGKAAVDAANDPLIGNLASGNFSDYIVDSLQIPIRLDHQMHSRRSRADPRPSSPSSTESRMTRRRR